MEVNVDHGSTKYLVGLSGVLRYNRNLYNAHNLALKCFFLVVLYLLYLVRLWNQDYFGIYMPLTFGFGQGRSGDLKVPFHFMCTCSLCHYVPDYSFSLGFRDRQTPIRVIFLAGVKQPLFTAW